MKRLFVKFVAALAIFSITISDAVPIIGLVTAQASTVVFDNVDTLLIYNPLRMHEADVFIQQGRAVDYQNKSTGDMTGQIVNLPKGSYLRTTSGSSDGSIKDYGDNKTLALKPVNPFDLSDGIESFNAEIKVFNPLEPLRVELLETNETSSGGVNYFNSVRLYAPPTVGEKRTFKVNQVDKEFQCLAIGSSSVIWGAVADPNFSVLEANASSMVREMDEKVITSNHNYFGVGRFVNPSNGAHLNALCYSMNSGTLGFCTTLDFYGSNDATDVAAATQIINLDTAIIHINSDQIANYVQKGNMTMIYGTLAHEYQHSIGFTDYFDNSNKLSFYGKKTALVNRSLNFIETWANEAMSMAASEYIYPGYSADNLYLYAYNVSDSHAKGKSIYDFIEEENTGASVYGAVTVFQSYVRSTYGDMVFKKIHDYWRANENQTEGKAFSYAVDALKGYNPSYNAETLAALTTTIPNNITQDEVLLSKIVLNSYIAQVQQQIGLNMGTTYNSSLYYTVTHMENPLLYTGTDPATIAGGGRILVKPINDTYQVPADADPELIYVGFDKDGNVTLEPTHAIQPSYSNSYDWGQGPSGQILPSDANRYKSVEEAKAAKDSSYSAGQEVSGNKEGRTGIWRFSGWDEGTVDETSETVTYRGSWQFIPSQTTTESTTQITTKSTTKATTQSTTKATTESTTKATTKPMTESTTKTTTKPTTKSTTVATTQSTTKPTTELTTKSATKATTESTTKATTKATTATTTEPTTQSTTESTTESTTQATTQADTEKTLKSVYRLYQSVLKVHLYTTDANERDTLKQVGWTYEGEAWKTSTTEGSPVYRLYHTGLKIHLYTTDSNEYQVLAGRGWRQEGVAYQSSGETPIYRLYHTGIKKHHFTKDVNEYNTLATRGWRQEGVAWYSEK